jgi:1-acyl-sn-glycerol-3-phosphate acyltransferase
MDISSLGSLLVNRIIYGLFRILCIVKDADIQRVPLKGPLILATNHINFLEAPVIYTHLVPPRPLTALVKVETLDVKGYGWLFKMWNAIPIRRGEADLEAFQKAQQALKDGMIVVVAPEGTRSGDGRLGPGYPGIILLALRAGVPVLPLVFQGSEVFWQNLKKLKRTPFIIRVGNPFSIDMHGKALSRDVRKQATDELMYQLAALLPEEYRGVYSDMSQASEEFISFAPGVESNLANKDFH